MSLLFILSYVDPVKLIREHVESPNFTIAAKCMCWIMQHNSLHKHHLGGRKTVMCLHVYVRFLERKSG